jgi:hypothetical protein
MTRIPRLLSATLAVAVLALGPAPATAQFGAVEALVNRVSDLSFFFSSGGTLPGSDALESEPFDMTSFGVELLLEVARVPSRAGRERVAAAGTTTRHVLQRIEVIRSQDGVDTVYHYDVNRVSPGFRDSEILWTLEVGIGYGQLQGLRLAHPELDLNTSIRTLPAVSLYLSYEPIGTYLGLRTGLLRADGLQVTDSSGALFNGDAETFMMGALAGYAFSLEPTYLFLEAGYTVRSFPSVEWSTRGGTPRPDLPRSLDISGWMIGAGIQFPVR